MKPINTVPIEDFLNKARIAIKSNQKNLTLTQKEIVDLQNSLSVVMTRLVGISEQNATQNIEKITVNMDGGKF